MKYKYFIIMGVIGNWNWKFLLKMLHLLLQQEHKTYSFRESTDGIDTLDVFPDELSLTLAENKH